MDQIVFWGIVALIMLCFWRAIVECLFRASIALLLSGGLGIVSAQVAELEGDAWLALCLGIATASFFPVLGKVSQARGPLAGKKAKRSKSSGFEPSPEGGTAKTNSPIGCSEIQEKSVNDGWKIAELILPEANLADVKKACCELLELAESPSMLDPAVIERAVFVRRQIPGLLADAHRYLAVTSDATERLSILTRLEADLIALGDTARVVLAAHLTNVRAAWDLRHKHVTSRLVELNDLPGENEVRATDIIEAASGAQSSRLHKGRLTIE